MQKNQKKFVYFKLKSVLDNNQIELKIITLLINIFIY